MTHPTVMAGLRPGHPRLAASEVQNVDARDKRGHDESELGLLVSALMVRSASSRVSNHEATGQAPSAARHLPQGSLSKPSASPFRLKGKPMPSSGVSKMMKVAVLAAFN
jgi:hypothetical protein